MPTVTLSTAALVLFRLHVERQGQGQIVVDDSTHELEAAGLVMNSRPFVGKQLYALTRAPYEMKHTMDCAWESA